MTALDHVDRTVQVEAERDNPNIILRILWFLLVGWWLGFWAIVAGYLCLILVIPAPLGIALLNRLPRIMTLRAPTQLVSVHQHGATVEIERTQVRQRSWLIRIPWLILIGWWFGAIWLLAAYLITICTLGIGLPLSFWMFGRAGKVISLYRS
ncbi:MAG: YccF domain-containing protein [Thermomicrobiales bacterium]|nr:YccF domain-containing protein [Thermomicrobiales bacterium]